MTAQFPALDRLAYSIQSLADATDLSYETVRQAVANGDLAPKYSGRKAVIPREEAERWLRSLPDSPVRAAS